MKFGIFLILLSCCLYLAAAKPNYSSAGSEENSKKVPSKKSDSDEFSDESSESGSDKEDEGDWFENLENQEKTTPEDEGLNEKDRKLLERLRNVVVAHGSVQATKRLQQDLSDCFHSEAYKRKEIDVELIGGSLYEMNVYVRHFDTESALYKDLQELKRRRGIDSIVFHFKFNAEYPFKPPFVRLVSPVVSSGHILGGGAVCAELLTNKSWKPTYGIEATVTEIIYHMIDGGGRIHDQTKDAAESQYNLHSAMLTFENTVQNHFSRW